MEIAARMRLLNPQCSTCRSNERVVPLANPGGRDRWVCCSCGKEWDMGENEWEQLREKAEKAGQA